MGDILFKKKHLFSHIIILIFFLGVLLPLTNNSLAITNTGEIPDVEVISTSDPPIDDLLEPKDNNPPTYYSPANGIYLSDTTPYFDWSTVAGSDVYNIQVSQYSAFTSLLIDSNQPQHSAYQTVTPLPQGILYWRVRTRHTVFLIPIWGPFGPTWSLTIDTIAPAPPTLASPLNNIITNDNTVYFDWNGVTGCNRYRFQVDETSSFSSPRYDIETSATGFTSPALPDGPYYWRVQARDYAGNWGSWCSMRHLVVDTVPPSIPSLVSPIHGLVTVDTTPTFVWSEVATADEYQLQVTPTGNYGDSVIDLWSSATSYSSSVLPDGTYTWHVRARDSVPNVGSWSSSWYVVIDTSPPGIPTLILPSNGAITSDTTVYLDWSNVVDATEYHVQVDDDPAYGSPVVDQNVLLSEYTTISLSDGQYYWRVMARDDVGNWGSYSASRTFTVDTISPVISNSGVTPETPDDDDTPVFNCTATDLNGLSSIILHFRIDGGTWDTETMTLSFGNTYEYTFSALHYSAFFEYYFEAHDNAITSNSDLDDNGGAYYNFTVISHDTTGPTIFDVKHEPANPTELDSNIIYANVTDPCGINYTKLIYRINGGGWLYENMTLVTAEMYNATIGVLFVGDVVEYYIESADNSAIFNVAIDDNSGTYYGFTVGSTDSTGPTITDVQMNILKPNESDTITIICQVTDDNGVQAVTLHYRLDGGTWMTVSMVLISGDTYSVNIGPFSSGVIVEYFISATDNHVIHNESIEDNGGLYYSFTIGSSDVTGPVITNIVHTPNPTSIDLVNITCTVTDLNDVQTVTLYYKIIDGSWESIVMTLVSGDVFKASIGPFTTGDVVSYYIVAVDDSLNHNDATDDNSGAYYSFTVVAPTTDVPFYYLLPMLAVFSLIVLIRKRK